MKFIANGFKVSTAFIFSEKMLTGTTEFLTNQNEKIVL